MAFGNPSQHPVCQQKYKNYHIITIITFTTELSANKLHLVWRCN